MEVKISEKLRRTISLFSAILMMLSLFAAVGSDHTYAAKKYKLPTKVVYYYYYKGKWHKDATDTYKYDKKRNITVRKNGYAGITEKYKITYKKGKIRKVAGVKGTKAVRYYSSKGRITKEKNGKFVTKFKTNSKGYITKATGTFKHKNTIKYQDNGMPSTIVSKDSSSYITTITFNENGYVSLINYRWGSGDSDYFERQFEYSRSGDKLTAIAKLYYPDEDKWEYDAKYVYTFGSANTADKRKYVAMMGGCMDYGVMAGIMPEHFFVYGNG